MPDPNGFLQQFLGVRLHWLYRESVYWTAVGLFGNGLFSSRFFIQWLQSERQKRLVVPAVFWYLSFWGSLVSLIYAFHVDKLPVILSYLFLPFIYGRNLKLLRHSASRPTEKIQT